MFVFTFASKAGLFVSNFYSFVIVDIFTFIFFNDKIIELLQTFGNCLVSFIPKMNFAYQLARINEGEDFSNQTFLF